MYSCAFQCNKNAFWFEILQNTDDLQQSWWTNDIQQYSVFTGSCLEPRPSSNNSSFPQLKPRYVDYLFK
ncbi:hypothetical protein VNO77_01696 [Canavalia gladiata]|uniref:Uncharacterized protein n=1 Tax=Canavalia gladiata TaxID=3824 RepID=A0AAN9MSC8_CANGL